MKLVEEDDPLTFLAIETFDRRLARTFRRRMALLLADTTLPGEDARVRAVGFGVARF